MDRDCSNCKTANTKLQCSCATAFYCDVSCQKVHWCYHKFTCPKAKIMSYQTRCDNIVTLIRKDFPTIPIIIKKLTSVQLPQDYTSIEFSITEIRRSFSLTILADSDWSAVKRKIEQNIATYGAGGSGVADCSLCYTSAAEISTEIKTVGCNRCSFKFCGECYINLFKFGKGIITCPACRCKTGQVMTDWMLVEGERQIRAKLSSGLRI